MGKLFITRCDFWFREHINGYVKPKILEDEKSDYTIYLGGYAGGKFTGRGPERIIYF